MGVAPHPGYEQTPSVVGMPHPYKPQSPNELSALTLKSMKKKHTTEFDRIRDPSPWSSTQNGVQKFLATAIERNMSNEAVQQKNHNVAPSNSSGFAYSEGVTSRAHSGYGRRDNADAYHPQTLKAMKTKNPVEFYDLIRHQRDTSCDTQTTSDNFQMLGTHANDPKFYWTSKTAVGLM